MYNIAVSSFLAIFSFIIIYNYLCKQNVVNICFRKNIARRKYIKITCRRNFI